MRTMVPLSLSLLLGLALLLTAPGALAQGGGGTPGGVITEIKSPPLQNSDEFALPISIHNTVSIGSEFFGWAGAIMQMHLLDNSELDADAFHAIMPTRYTPPGGIVALPTVPPSGVIASPLGVRSRTS